MYMEFGENADDIVKELIGTGIFESALRRNPPVAVDLKH